MQWSKVKTILIAILIIVDAFLLLDLFGSFYTDYRREAEKNENFKVVLARKGIIADETLDLPKAVSLPMLEVDRSKNDEDAFTKGLLGDNVERTEEIDGSTVYHSSAGRVEWSSEGKIAGYFNLESYELPTSESEIRVLTAKILEHCGISSSIEIAVDFEKMCSTATFDTAGAPVFNRQLQLYFGVKQISINGWWTFQTPYMVQTNNYILSESTDAILALLNEIHSVKSIVSAEIGYILSTGSGRQTSIVPCCRILTDQGEYFVDSLKNVVIYP